jgi:hypothetical protein
MQQPRDAAKAAPKTQDDMARREGSRYRTGASPNAPGERGA